MAIARAWLVVASLVSLHFENFLSRAFSKMNMASRSFRRAVGSPSPSGCTSYNVSSD